MEPLDGHSLYSILQEIAGRISGVSLSLACREESCECILFTCVRDRGDDTYRALADIFRKELADQGIVTNWARILCQAVIQMRKDPEGSTVSLELYAKDFWWRDLASGECSDGVHGPRSGRTTE